MSQHKSSGQDERRQHPRFAVSSEFKLHHGPSGRDFPAHAADASAGGLLVYVPLAAPVAVGHKLRLTLGTLGRPELACLAGRECAATVVRVDRQRVPTLGYLPVGVQFDS